MSSPARREQDSGLTSDHNDMQLIEESNTGMERPADSRLIAIKITKKRKGMESPDEEGSSGNSEWSDDKISSEEEKFETGIDEHLHEKVKEDGACSDETTDEDIPELMRRSGVKEKFCLVLMYADKFKDGDPTTNHKEFLDEIFRNSDASKTYLEGSQTEFGHSFNVNLTKKERQVLCGRDEVYYLSTPRGRYQLF